MSQASEKFFSVVTEQQDGKTHVLRVKGSSPADAFRQAKDLPGVRRVGKVTEVGQGGSLAPAGRPLPGVTREASRPRIESPRPNGSPAHAAPREAGVTRDERGRIVSLDQPIAGPRVVVHARRIGGEQPFKHLQAPPERPVPPRPPKAVTAPVAAPTPAPAAPVAQPASLGRDAIPQLEAAPDSPVEYRIIKTRRRGSQPYLLQRGRWQSKGDKRVFGVDWEKDFAEREVAEKHRAWLEKTTEEIDELDLQLA